MVSACVYEYGGLAVCSCIDYHAFLVVIEIPLTLLYTMIALPTLELLLTVSKILKRLSTILPA